MTLPRAGAVALLLLRGGCHKAAAPAPLATSSSAVATSDATGAPSALPSASSGSAVSCAAAPPALGPIAKLKQDARDHAEALVGKKLAFDAYFLRLENRRYHRDGEHLDIMAVTITFADAPGDVDHALECDLRNQWLPPGLAPNGPIRVVGSGSTTDSLWPRKRAFYLNDCMIEKR